MTDTLEIHPVQMEVLRKLLFTPSARFSQLNVTGIDNDHFSFHLRRLVETGWVEKSGRGYGLTTVGKEIANRMDTETRKIERQPKTAVLVVISRIVSKKVEYLLQQRLKQPYYGYYGFVSGKVRWGEKIEEAAKRELTEETGLVGEKVSMVGIEHKLDSKDGVLLEDKFFYITAVAKTTGILIEEFEGGKNLWVKRAKIMNLPKLFPDVEDVLRIVESRGMKFVEKIWKVEDY